MKMDGSSGELPSQLSRSSCALLSSSGVGQYSTVSKKGLASDVTFIYKDPNEGCVYYSITSYLPLHYKADEVAGWRPST